MSAVGQPVDLVDLAARAFSRYREGDAAPMAQFVERVTPVLWHLARGQGLSTSSAEDVVQQAWLRLVEKSEQISDPRAVLKWLMTTTRREAWRLAQRGLREELAPEAPEPAAAESNDALGQVLEVAEREILWRHVAQLSERCRYLLRVIAFADTPDYATIAAALGMPVGSIGPTRGRCLAALRTALLSDPAFDLGGSR